MTIAERKEREKEQRRKEILDTAESLFYAHGYDDVAMDDIAKKAELNKATIYLYFKNKDALFLEVVLRGLVRLQVTVNAGVNAADPPREKLLSLWDAYLGFANANPEFSRLYAFFRSSRFQIDAAQTIEITPYHAMSFADLEGIGFASETLKEIVRIRKELLQLTKEIMEQGRKEGTLKAQTDPLEQSLLFHTLMDNIGRVQQDYLMLLAASGIDRDRYMGDMRAMVSKMFFP